MDFLLAEVRERGSLSLTGAINMVHTPAACEFCTECIAYSIGRLEYDYEGEVEGQIEVSKATHQIIEEEKTIRQYNM